MVLVDPFDRVVARLASRRSATGTRPKALGCVAGVLPLALLGCRPIPAVPLDDVVDSSCTGGGVTVEIRTGPSEQGPDLPPGPDEALAMDARKLLAQAREPIVWGWAGATGDYAPETYLRLERPHRMWAFREMMEIVVASGCPVVDARLSWSQLPTWWRPPAVKALVDSIRENPEHQPHFAGLAGLWLTCDEPPCLLVTTDAVPYFDRLGSEGGVLRIDTGKEWTRTVLPKLVTQVGWLQVFQEHAEVRVWAVRAPTPAGGEGQDPPACPMGSAQARRLLELRAALDDHGPKADRGPPWAREIAEDIERNIRRR